MEISEKLDLAWMIAHGMQDIDLAHAARLKADEEAAEAAREARRVKGEKKRQEHYEHLRAILAKHPTRWAVSIDGKLVVPDKKGVQFECPDCKSELPQVLENLGMAMGGTFERLWTEDFSNSSGHAHIVVSELTCQCGQRVMYRCIPLPF